MKPVLTAAVCFVLAASAVPVSASEALPRVYEVRGLAETRSSETSPWRRLAAGSAVGTGTHLRAGEKSGALIGFDPELESLAYLDERSEVQVGPDGRWKLMKGKLFWLREPTNHPKGSAPVSRRPLEVALPGALLPRLSSGGCVLSAETDGSGLIRVFGGAVVSGAVTVPEGFKLRSAAKDAPARMGFDDYKDWQVLIRYFYEKRDDLVADLMEKESVKL